MQFTNKFSQKMFDCVRNNTTAYGFLSDCERECPESGFDPYKAGKNYLGTPIHAAAQQGKLEIVETIAKLGGQYLLTLEDRAGYTPLRRAIIGELTSPGNKFESPKNYLVVHRLIELGVPVYEVHEEEEFHVYQPIELAITNGKIQTAALLLKHGATIPWDRYENYDYLMVYDQKEYLKRKWWHNEMKAGYEAALKILEEASF